MKLSSLAWGPIMRDEASTREWFSYAKEIGLDGVEVMDGWFNPSKRVLWHYDGDLLAIRRDLFQPEITRRVKEELAEFGHEVSMLTIHNRFCRFLPEEQREEVEHIRLCGEVAKEFGTDRLRVIASGWPREGEEISHREALEACIDTARLCAEAAQQEGFYLLLENHGELTAQVDDFAEILRRVDNPHFSANLDCKNAGRAGLSPLEFLDREEISSRLMCLHADNYLTTPEGLNRTVAVEEGEVDIAAALRRVKASGYDGWISIEYGGKGFEKIGRSAEYIRRVWDIVDSCQLQIQSS